MISHIISKIFMNKNFDWVILIIVVINPELLGFTASNFWFILKHKLEKNFVFKQFSIQLRLVYQIVI